MEELLKMLIAIDDMSKQGSTQDAIGNGFRLIAEQINTYIEYWGKRLVTNIDGVSSQVESMKESIQVINDSVYTISHRIQNMYYLVIFLSIVIVIMLVGQIYLIKKVKRVETMLMNEKDKKEEGEEVDNG